MRVQGLLITVVATLVSVGTFAQPPREAPPARAHQILLELDDRLKRIDELLVAGEGKKAYTRTESLIHDMGATIMGGPGVGQLLGVATVLRALAAYQLDRKDEALWHWHVATQMFPDVADFQLTAYGNAGEFLKSHPLGRSFERGPLPDFTHEFERPKKLRDPKPSIPAARRGSSPVSVMVSAMIDRDGRLREPRILKSEGELTLVCATLDRLRDWEFKPATNSGKPVTVPFVLTVNFRP